MGSNPRYFLKSFLLFSAFTPWHIHEIFISAISVLIWKYRRNAGKYMEIRIFLQNSFQPFVPCFACRNLSMSWLHPSDLTSRENEREAIEINWFLRETFARKLTTMINHWTSEQRLQSEHCFAACSKLIKFRAPEETTKIWKILLLFWHYWVNVKISGIFFCGLLTIS